MKYVALILVLTVNPHLLNERGRVVVSHHELHDRIKGGWYGQVIGAMIALRQDSTAFSSESYLKAASAINMDLLLLKVFQANGIAASRKDFVDELVATTLPLQHAYKTARWNLGKGQRPPQSGDWTNNPHADDHDFLVASDVLGLISPGLPKEAHALSDHIGHISNGGDGYYGGLFVATLYALAFGERDRETSIVHALNSIPVRSKFSIVINDALDKVAQFPADPIKAGQKFIAKWDYDIHCPDEKFRDSKYHAAWLTMALMYGKGDFHETFRVLKELHAPAAVFASAGGILGAWQGYEHFDDLWKDQLTAIESETLPFSAFTLQQAVDETVRLACSNIEDNGGKVKEKEVVILTQKPSLAKLEKSFEGHCNKESRDLHDVVVRQQFDFEFEGVGFVVRGILPYDGAVPPRTIRAELYLNNKYIEDLNFVPDYQPSQTDLVWKLQLPYKKYKASIRLLDPSELNTFKVSAVTVYDVPVD